MRIKLSQSDWKQIGTKMGWLKESQSDYWRYLRKGTDIVGYTYDADEHSPAETRAALKNGVLKATNPDAPLDEHGIPESGVEDSEGNEIHPVFATDESASNFDDDGEKKPELAQLQWSLLTMEGMPVARGNFQYSDWSGMGNELGTMLKGKACGPDGPVYGVEDDPKEWKDADASSYTFDAYNEDGTTCGIVKVKRIGGQPFDW